jgi:hypothetical protein
MGETDGLTLDFDAEYDVFAEMVKGMFLIRAPLGFPV